MQLPAISGFDPKTGTYQGLKIKRVGDRDMLLVVTTYFATTPWARIFTFDQ